MHFSLENIYQYPVVLAALLLVHAAALASAQVHRRAVVPGQWFLVQNGYATSRLEQLIYFSFSQDYRRERPSARRYVGKYGDRT